ncbi:hypothetical protein ACVI1J_001500 [Bradyrhizobium diazoefficiens]
MLACSRPAQQHLPYFSYILSLWIIFGDGLKWYSLATLATSGMTLVIQRAEHRDTQTLNSTSC